MFQKSCSSQSKVCTGGGGGRLTVWGKLHSYSSISASVLTHVIGLIQTKEVYNSQAELSLSVPIHLNGSSAGACLPETRNLHIAVVAIGRLVLDTICSEPPWENTQKIFISNYKELCQGQHRLRVNLWLILHHHQWTKLLVKSLGVFLL